ncbi:unnamed protein product [Caenorhabditis auriculariae]|uniref:non-specific serine/threonine protein kinase n=1 Tax=Caenorhabditis auriculariae TaxID=2777116 RepID=A0A8S1GT71_9PELO|nr:unnamed protein product [Caenorhabditis auriculariae]
MPFMDSFRPPQPTLRLGDYVIGETIGHGTFGKVKLGHYVKTGQKVALKIMSRQTIKSMDIVSKIRREIENLSVLDHPHVIKLYKVISTATDIFMIMEYVAGGELFSYIVKCGRLDTPEARRFFQQIISGLDYCHRRKVVHRDLKPENILLDNKKNIKIADFGLSNFMPDGDFLKTSCGSPNYAAPEIVNSCLYAGPEVDIWSSGIILYALLCGQLPFDDKHVTTLFQKIRAGTYYMPHYVEPQAADLIRSMLCVDPIKRATMKEIIHHPWFRIDLPNYLFPPNTHARTSIVDIDIVKEVAERYKVTEEEVTIALVSDDPQNPLLIAYNLFVENVISDGHSKPLARLPVEDLEKQLEQQSHNNKAVTFGIRKAKWHLGIRSSNQPHEIMMEVFNVMLKLNMEWKILNTYHIIAKASLQLYKLDDRMHLLDFKQLVEDEFLDEDEQAIKDVKWQLGGGRQSASSCLSNQDSASDTANLSSFTVQFLEICVSLINALSG